MSDTVRDELLARLADEGVEKAAMFGSLAIRLEGKIIATFRDDRAAIKVGRDSPLLLEALENGEQLFDPSGKKRPMKDWLLLCRRSADELEPYLLEAIALQRA